jgi:RNA polymerase sigma-70 factor (ECF subfamily)
MKYPFYFAALGEFDLRSGRYEAAREQFRKAVALARNPTERRFLEARIAACKPATAITAS